MTREEAINKLVNARYADEFQGDEELTTAHLMAINALEQQPSENGMEKHTDRQIYDGCIHLMQKMVDYFQEYLEYLGYDLDMLDERERDQKSYPGAVNRAEVKKIAKEMYLEVANMDIDATTISDCISCTASKCREVLERKLRALPLATLAHKKGTWIYHEKSISTGFKDMRECSCCHCYFRWEMPRNSYCPNCGAEMESE